MSRVLILIASAPGAAARDGVDAALAAIAYGHEVAILLVGDAVTATAGGQSPQRHGVPDLSRALAACLHHGAVALAASAHCLSVRGIVPSLAGLQQMDAGTMSNWIGAHAHVHRF